jgi:hypothetical protein
MWLMIAGVSAIDMVAGSVAIPSTAASRTRA